MKRELDEIYRLYAADVYRYIYSKCRNESLSQDILQDTMLKAVTEYGKFRGECSVKTWLCKIAANLFYNHCKRSESKNLSLDETEGESEENIEEKIGDSEQALRIHQILHTLDEPYKEIFTLRVFAELKFSEIASVFGKSENWARVTFFRAKEKIIKIMKEEENP